MPTNQSLDFVFIIPVFNEEKVIAQTIDQTHQALAQISDMSYQIVCINDGSTDRSSEILKSRKDIQLIEHPVNRGYGASLRTGILVSSAPWIAIIDADGTYPIQDFPRFIAELNSQVKMVVGKRVGDGIGMSPFKRIARWVLRRIVQIVTGVFVPDLNSGMRVFHRSLFLECLPLLPTGFSFTTTLTVASLYSGHHVTYIPINYSRRIGNSNIRPVRDFIFFVTLILRLTTYFEPLRFFVPISMVLFLFGVIRAIRDVIVTNGFGSVSIIFLVSSLQVLITGVLADLIVRRTAKEGRL